MSSLLFSLVMHCLKRHNTESITLPVSPASSGNCRTLAEIIALCSQLLISWSYGMWHLFVLFSFTLHVKSEYQSIFAFFGSVYSCYCVVYVYLPISGLLVSYVNVYGDVIFVCLWLGSLLSPLRLQASMVLVFIMNCCSGLLLIELFCEYHVLIMEQCFDLFNICE